MPIKRKSAVKPSVDTVQSSYQELSATAAELNQVSDQLSRTIGDLDAALKKLNLGISSWVVFRESISADRTSYFTKSIGYAKVKGKWGIAIKSAEGDYRFPDEEHVEKWSFEEAPRHLRLNALSHIPELLVCLTKETADFTKKVSKKLEQTQDLAAAIKEIAKQS